MAAGLGYIEFATGDVLTAATANGYLASQTVMVFASSAARASAITSPQEGMFSYLKDTNATEYYTGSAWAALGGGGGGGKVLQVVQGVLSANSNVVGTTYADVVSVSITPTLNTSKVLIMISNPQRTITASASYCYGLYKVLRGATALQDDMISTGHVQTAGNFATWSTFAFNYLDSPATTSATTYKLQAKGDAAGTTVQSNYSGITNGTTIIAMEIGA
jgi:hypothetical protein